MPSVYKRKGTVNRGEWTAESLVNAIEAVAKGTMGVNEAAREFGIPKTTLKRRLKSDNKSKTDRLGPPSCLGDEAENKLVNHILKLQKHGFAPDRDSVRKMAYELAEKLKVKHTFNSDKGKAGYDWLKLFLSRHPEISVRKAEGISNSRATGLCKENVREYFRLLAQILDENNLNDKPGHIFNVDETGLQLNNKPGHVLAKKGSKCVANITSAEKGETISVVACCNAEGMFLPPYCIFKGKNRKDEFSSGMPPGSYVAMSEKSAYINADIFLHWLKSHFLPRKPNGKVLLILDGHASHTNSISVLEFTEENDIILLCLPAHTTHFLQPLDRSFFKSLKTYYYSACNSFMKTNPARKLGRLQFGELLGCSWNKAATVQNGVSGFRATGVFPFWPDAIPEYAYLTTKTNINTASGENNTQTSSSQSCTDFANNDVSPSSNDPQPSCSHYVDKVIITPPSTEIITPGKLLDDISPVPNSTCVQKVKRRGRQLAEILNTPENIGVLKNRKRPLTKATAPFKKRKAPLKKTTRRFKTAEAPISDTSDSDSPVLDDRSSDGEAEDNAECVGCGEEYYKTKRRDEWLCCIICKRWMHEGCTGYANICNDCGKIAAKKK